MQVGGLGGTPNVWYSIHYFTSFVKGKIVPRVRVRGLELGFGAPYCDEAWTRRLSKRLDLDPTAGGAELEEMPISLTNSSAPFSACTGSRRRGRDA